jgi:competence protein ComEC
MMMKNFLPVLCLSFLMGIGLGTFFNFDFNPFGIFLILLFLIILSIAGAGNRKFKIAALGLAFLFLGVWRIKINEPIIDKENVAFYNVEEKLTFIGQVVGEPDERVNNTKLTMGKIILNKKSLRGKILLSAPNFPVYQYGDWLQFTCPLETPAKIEDFDYGKYLAVKGIYSVCYWPEGIKFLENYQELNSWQKIQRSLINFKFKYKEAIDKTVRYPQGEVLSAMVIGLRRSIPQDVLDDFTKSGILHAISISGLHITIVVFLLLNFFITIGFWRKQAFWLAVISLITFLILIGFMAPAIRAGIMGFMTLLAMQIGRLNKGLNGLLLSAMILLLINPLLLIFDVSFQLTFLAMLGLIYFYKPVEKILEKMKVPERLQMRSSVAMTLSAQIFVLPLVLYYFGNLSPWSAITNILTMPVMPLVMILGFIGGLGMIYLPLGQIVGYATNLVVGWIIWVTKEVSNLPGSGFHVEISLFLVIIIYIIIVMGTVFFKRKNYEK